MTAVWTALAAILIFCIMIFVHELGHFISAKLLGIRVHEFAIGMGPKLIGRRRGETLYSVRLLPLGGFCALEGENESSDDEKALSNKPAWAKLIVMAAGSCMNLLLGLVLLFCLYSSVQTVVVPQVDTVVAGGPADLAGVQVGDEIIKMDGRRIHIAYDMHWVSGKLTGEPFELVVKRPSGLKETLTVTPGADQSAPKLGITMKQEENGFFLTAKTAYYETVFYGRVVLESFIDLLRGRIGISSMSGPVGIVSEIGGAVQQAQEQGLAGLLNLLQMTVLLTVNLGVFNLLPIPALDGGRIFFVLIEMIRRKPIPPEKEGIVHFVGFVLLILLSLFIAYMDVLRLV